MKTNDFMELNENTSEVKEAKKFPFLKKLEIMMEEAKLEDAKKSKMKRVHKKGNSQIAKKMGEEAVEMVIASEQDNDENFLEESADVFFYYLMALHARGFELKDVLEILKKRHKK
ncbi:phosphoribosyl-ATP diphosphatase [Empedobacter falsenii]|uniref:phosphoribosyl-ATP diphosphatase n=1 Tax=Empedobacter falsenii TaxID=343874 RepID=A0A7H9DPN2_9FLAO|nr:MULTISPECIES: phosphoribosyl-ATP diphosphatase [Empedobacter]MDH2207743.1 phosphoribosyl-ATP diphosphatase [Empedobacter sp. GD03644]MDM1063884.1 phosphoribosyl-ATP diphosphatase [Empedobacter falsenii]MDM1551426.1 phosphoribosyl-ATP diphosphatase [Empedobacter falsenii]QLL57123.1 phosphoribosyl-ATP diphosphatase [Empedobacter falsenii]